MHFAKRNIFALAAAAMTALSIGAEAAMAGTPTVKITVKNETASAAPLTYYPITSKCSASVKPVFADVAPGLSQSFEATSTIPELFSCNVTYKYEKKSYYGYTTTDECSWRIYRLTNFNSTIFNPGAKDTWAYPKSRLLTGDSRSCLHKLSGIEDTLGVVESSNGNFNVTLTVK